MKFHNLLRCLIGWLSLFAIASFAQATPIPFNGGTLDASLKLYDALSEPNGIVFVLRKEYVLGTDFIPGVPPSASVYHKEFGPAAVLFHRPSSEPLETGCNDSPFDGFFDPRFGWMVVRGVCTFNEKWLNIENKGYAAGIVVNNMPGGLIFLGGITSDVTIPFFLVTDVVGAELKAGSFFDNEPGIYPEVSMSVTWTPNDVGNVAEPATLALLGLGLAGLGWSRRQK